MKKYIIILFVITSTLIKAQSLKESTADKFYSEMAYASAAPIYKELALEKKATQKNIRRAAQCYKNLNDLKTAEFWYEKLVTTNQAEKEDVYEYVQLLKSNAQYTKAAEYMQRLNSLQSYPIFVKRSEKNNHYYTDLKVDSSKYITTNAGINTEESDFSPIIYKDEVYFTSNRRNVSVVNKKFAWDDSYFLDEYKGTFKDGKFSNVGAMPRDIDSKYHEGPAALSPDGNTMYITRSNYIDKKLGKTSQRVVNLKIFISKKNDKGQWGELQSLPFNSEEYSIGHPAISPNGKILYFVSDMPGGFGQTDIWETTFENNTWSKPENLGAAINSEGREMFPSVFEDGTLFFASDGNAGLGGLDIYLAVPQMDKFFDPQNVGYPLNTNADDFGFYLNKDIKSGYLSSNRTGGKGKDDIYSFTSLNPIIPQYFVEGTVTNEYTKDTLPNSTVDLYDNQNKLITTVKTDNKGHYKLPLLAGQEYKLDALQENYSKAEITLNSKDPNNKTANRNMALKPAGMYVLQGLVSDASTNQPLSDVLVLIKNKTTNEEVLKTLTTNDGDFEKILANIKQGDEINYEVSLQKQGYETKTISYINKAGLPGTIKLNEILDMKLNPNGNVAANTNNNPNNTNTDNLLMPVIYFDLDKADIRTDAQLELNKLALLLTQRKDIKIEITSHTDCRASENYNMRLSKKRSEETAAYLQSRGVNKNQLKLKWVGESQLRTNCPCEPTNESACSEDQHQLNRTANFKVFGYKIQNKKMLK